MKKVAGPMILLVGLFPVLWLFGNGFEYEASLLLVIVLIISAHVSAKLQKPKPKGPSKTFEIEAVLKLTEKK